MSIDESAPRSYGWLRAIGVFIGVVIGLAFVLAAVIVGVFVHTMGKNSTPPDVAKVARSSAVAGADDQAVPLLDRSIAAAVAVAPKFTLGPRGVDDTCGSEPGGSFGQGWSSVSCSRTVAQVLSCDCDVRAGMRVWDRALAGGGWHGSDSAPAPSGPSAGWLNYTDVNRVYLEITWGGSADRGLFHGPWRPLESKPAPRAGAPLDIKTAVTEALARHRMAVVVTVEQRYYG